MKKMTEMKRLHRMLKENGIHYFSLDNYGGVQTVVRKGRKSIASVIYYFGSLGFTDGLLEVWDGNRDEEPEGFLSAEDVLEYIKKRL